VKPKNFDARVLQRPNGFVYVTARNQTMIRDEQRASKIQLTCKLAQLRNHAGAKHDSCARLKIKTLHVF
jgi:hypothetical protein